MDRFFKKILLLLSMVFVFVSLKGQSVNVLNKVTKLPVEGVSIFNKAQNISSITNKKGFFDLKQFSENDTLYFKHLSYDLAKINKQKIQEANYTVFLNPSIFLIEEFQVTANMRDNPDELPYKIDIIEAKAIKSSNAQTSAEILQSTGNVMIQKSQGGGGSPMIRGYEANKILLVIDGVRLNNAIYRNGHLQNSITIGQSMLERIELVFGPSSIAYGSDAIGGVVHYHTKRPALSLQKKAKLTVNTGLQYATANKGTTGYFNFSIGKKRFSSLTGFQYSNFGDIHIGTNREFTSNDDNFGYTNFYVSQNSLGLDTMLSNPKPEIQLNTTYKQYDFLQKFLIVANKKIDINLNFQYSTSSNIARYDQLTEYDNDILKYAEWYYGPQKRLLASASALFKYDNRFFTNLKTTFAYQNIHEDRISRKFQNAEQLHQNELVDVYSVNFDFLKLIGVNRIDYGFELSHNSVGSKANYTNIFSNQQNIAQTRYPDGGSIMQSASAYINYKWNLHNKSILTTGFRYSYYHLYSEFLNNPALVQLPFNKIKINNAAPTGIISFEMYPADAWKIRTVLSSGFRSPNVDDYGKIRAKSEQVTVPNSNLKPEYVYNAELGVQYQLKKSISIDISGYYNLLTDAIVRTDFRLNGQDSLFYDGDLYKITTNANAAKAVVTGLSIGLDANYPLSNYKQRKLHFRSTFNYNYGKNITENVPLGHISPVFGIIKFGFSSKKFTVNLQSMFQGLKKLENMSPYGEDNEDKGTAEGFPAWYTINIKSNYQINKNLSLRFSVENILNQMYRPFASGVSAGSRNFIFSVNFEIK